MFNGGLQKKQNAVSVNMNLFCETSHKSRETGLAKKVPHFNCSRFNKSSSFCEPATDPAELKKVPNTFPYFFLQSS